METQRRYATAANRVHGNLSPRCGQGDSRAVPPQLQGWRHVITDKRDRVIAEKMPARQFGPEREPSYQGMHAVRADQEFGVHDRAVSKTRTDRLVVPIQRGDGGPEPDFAVALDALIEHVHELAAHDAEMAILEQASAEHWIGNRQSFAAVRVENDHAVGGIVNRLNPSQAEPLTRVVAGAEERHHVVFVAQVVSRFDDHDVVTLTDQTPGERESLDARATNQDFHRFARSAESA